MEIVNKISEAEFQVGIYTIKFQQDERWLLINTLDDNKHEALFFERDEAIRHAIIKYTCGHLVSEGIRDLLTILIHEGGK
jgi:hypothetical protein